MIETKFLTSGLSAEYGDIILDTVNDYVIVTVAHGGDVVLEEKYIADASGRVVIRDIGNLAMTFFEENSFQLSAGHSGTEVVIQVSVLEKNAPSAVVKDVTIYPCTVDFSGSLKVDFLKLIPLSRATEKYTQTGRREWISFYAPGTVHLYAAYKGSAYDVANTVEFATLTGAGFYTLDVSPAMVSAAVGCAESDLIYYNVYKSAEAIIRFRMDERYFSNERTFIFRNCFGAQESYTMNGDENSARKWTRTFGQGMDKQMQISRDLERKNTVTSGYISGSEIDVLEDVCNSSQLCLLTNQGLVEVVITEEKFEIVDRADEVNQVEFTYRLAQYNQAKAIYKPFKKPRVFSGEFDKTFN